MYFFACRIVCGRGDLFHHHALIKKCALAHRFANSLVIENRLSISFESACLFFSLIVSWLLTYLPLRSSNVRWALYGGIASEANRVL